MRRGFDNHTTLGRVGKTSFRRKRPLLIILSRKIRDLDLVRTRRSGIPDRVMESAVERRDFRTEKKTETDEIGTKLDESSSGTKDENSENGINLDGPASNQSSEKMGRSKGSSGDMPMNVTLSLASETEASHGGHVVSGKLRISACIALQIICIAKECWVRLGPKQKIKACSLSWGTESPKLHEVAVHEKLHVVYQLIQHTSWASCIPSVSPKASFSSGKWRADAYNHRLRIFEIRK